MSQKGLRVPSQNATDNQVSGPPSQRWSTPGSARKTKAPINAGAHAVQNLADGLPALGIVAAVLGIIKTMGAISQPPEYLGKLIGSALVGTFLGVFLAYGFVGPFASRIGQVLDEEAQFYKIIKDVLVSHLHGNAAQISVELGRGSVPSSAQPSFAQMEEALNAAPTDI